MTGDLTGDLALAGGAAAVGDCLDALGGLLALAAAFALGEAMEDLNCINVI